MIAVSFIDRALTKTARLLEPETAHNAAIAFLKFAPFAAAPQHQPSLSQSICGLTFSNPLGLAAGFDKNAEVPNALLARGFGSVEVGTITPKPQAGNLRPRLFRLPEHQALINRFGFNNDGIEACVKRLEMRKRAGVLGINIGANKDSADRIADYVLGIYAFQRFADYFTVNISSPNTPGLRGLQTREALMGLTEAVVEARAKNAVSAGKSPPIFVKIAPDLEDGELDAIAAVALSSGIDGLIISNTTLARPVATTAKHRDEQGGFSGEALFERSTIMLARMRQRVGTNMPLIGVGGIHSAETALIKIEAGANLVQLYTGMVYGGFGLPSQMCDGLQKLVALRNAANISALTGVKTAEWAARRLEA
jgi:dihydroorotate dehydrogenase